MISPFPDDVAFVWAVPGAVRGDLTAAEQALLRVRASPRRRAEFALGRTCARQALRQLGSWDGQSPPPSILRAGRAPQWDVGVVGSLSHSQGWCAAAAGRAEHYRGLGVDLERVGRISERMLRRILVPGEQALLAALPPAERARWLTLVFSAKESLYKAIQPLTGEYLGFQDASLRVQGSGAAGALEWTLLKEGAAAWPSGTAGVGAYQVEGDWLVTGIWLPA